MHHDKVCQTLTTTTTWEVFAFVPFRACTFSLALFVFNFSAFGVVSWCAFWMQPLLVFTEWFTPSASYCWCHVFTRARTYLGDMDIFRYCKQNYQADLLFELVVRFTSLKSCPKKGAAQHGEREIFNNFFLIAKINITWLIAKKFVVHKSAHKVV